MDQADDSCSGAEKCFNEGKRLDWRQDKSAGAATLARLAFQTANDMGHLGATRALAHMVYEGAGGAKDRELGLILLWSAFRRGDLDALEELSDLMASFGDAEPGRAEGGQAFHLSTELEVTCRLLERVGTFIDGLVQKRMRQSGNS